jgi:hypothetical protein
VGAGNSELLEGLRPGRVRLMSLMRPWHVTNGATHEEKAGWEQPESPERLKQILSQANEYKGDPVLDNGTFADNTANTSESASARWELAAEVARNSQGMGHDRPTSTSDFEHPVLRRFLEATGARHPDDGEVQQSGRYVAPPGPDGKLRAVPRSQLAEYRAAVNLAKPAPPISEAEQADLELRRARAGGWLMDPDERARLNDGRGDPAAEMQAGW